LRVTKETKKVKKKKHLTFKPQTYEDESISS